MITSNKILSDCSNNYMGNPLLEHKLQYWDVMSYSYLFDIKMIHWQSEILESLNLYLMTDSMYYSLKRIYEVN